MGREKIWTKDQKKFYVEAYKNGEIPSRALIQDWVELSERWGDEVLDDNYVPPRLSFLDKATIAERIENGESLRSIGFDYKRRGGAIKDVYRRYLRYMKNY